MVFSKRAGPSRAGPRIAGDRRRWWALSVIALGMLMGVFDVTVVNVALPSIGEALDASAAGRQWVVTAYTVAFAGLLLVGGRVADRLGRRLAFLVALVGFATASALGGVAVNLGTLVAARAAQGMFAAVLAPAALSLVAVTFPDPRERGRAFAVFGLVMSAGAATGLVLGGALTEYLGWRWVFYVNVPLALTAIAGGLLVLVDDRRRARPSADAIGALTGTAGLVAIVYGFSLVPAHGWLATPTVGFLTAGVVSLLVFVVVERRVAEPLLPLRILAHRSRSGTYLAFVVVMVGMFGMFLLVSFYLQTVLGYTAVAAGVAFLPFATATFIASMFVGRAMTRLRPGVLLALGLALAAAGMAWLTRLDVDDAYTTVVLPALLAIGLGVGTVSPVAANMATFEIAERETGVASAVFNVAEQVGASIGLAVMNTIAATSATAYLASRQHLPGARLAGLVHGYTVATGWAAGLLAVGAVAVLLLVDARLRGADTIDTADTAVAPARPDCPTVDSPLTPVA